MSSSVDPQRGGTSRPQRVIQILEASVLYFAIVFATGFLFGSIRVLFVAPRFGERTAELIETPFMLVMTILAARWVVGRIPTRPSAGPRFLIGGIALAFLLLTELTVVLWLRGLTVAEYTANRDPIAGAVYVVMLVLFALMPFLLTRRLD